MNVNSMTMTVHNETRCSLNTRTQIKSKEDEDVDVSASLCLPAYMHSNDAWNIVANVGMSIAVSTWDHKKKVIAEIVRKASDASCVVLFVSESSKASQNALNAVCPCVCVCVWNILWQFVGISWGIFYFLFLEKLNERKGSGK
jgi:hypothetical protein